MTAVPRPSHKGTTSPASRRGSRSHDSPFSPRLTRETLSSPISPLLQIRRNRLSLHRLSPYPPLRMGFRWGEIDYGEMAEWSIAAVLKTVELRGSGGSNPSLSAEKERVQIANDLHPFSILLSGVGRIFKRRTLDITNSRNSLHALKASPHYSAPLTPFPFHYLCRGADELRFGWRR